MKVEMLLKCVIEEVASLKHDVEDLKEEIHDQRFEVRDSYVKKIKKLEAEGKSKKYNA